VEQYKSLHPAFESDVSNVLDPMSSVNRRNAIGGTSVEAVREQIKQAKIKLQGE
jgi:argininosuccinate lyase